MNLFHGFNLNRQTHAVKAKPDLSLPTRAQFYSNIHQQSFSLPKSIMFYISKNPSTPELYQKMIESCKYFFIKNPVIVVRDLSYGYDELTVNHNTKIDLVKFTSKFWITHQFYICPNYKFSKHIDHNILALILPKLFRCDAQILSLHDQTLSYRDLPLLLSSATEVLFDKVTVKNNDGSNVPLEKIVELSVNATTIEFEKPTVTTETMIELSKILPFSKLEHLSLQYIPETFDLQAFYIFMKKNKQIKFFLEFDNSISDAYKNQLEKIIDEIIATKTFDYKPASIEFDGMNEEKRFKLVWICNSH